MLGFLTRLFSNTTPAYRGEGQPTSPTSSGWGWFPGSPSYRTGADEPEPVSTPGPEPLPEPEPSSPEPDPEPVEGEGEDLGDGDEECPIVIERGEPVRARMPLTIVVRRSPPDQPESEQPEPQ